MEIEVIVVKENEDGSADLEVKMDAEARKAMLQYGLIEMLKNAAKQQLETDDWK